MSDLGGIGFSRIAELALGISSDDWTDQFGTISAMRSFEEWGEDKGVLIAFWHRFKVLEADGIVTVETPVRDDARERVNRYLARTREAFVDGQIRRRSQHFG